MIWKVMLGKVMMQEVLEEYEAWFCKSRGGDARNKGC